jgi:hypothetical protein
VRRGVPPLVLPNPTYVFFEGDSAPAHDQFALCVTVFAPPPLQLDQAFWLSSAIFSSGGGLLSRAHAAALLQPLIELAISSSTPPPVSCQALAIARQGAWALFTARADDKNPPLNAALRNRLVAEISARMAWEDRPQGHPSFSILTATATEVAALACDVSRDATFGQGAEAVASICAQKLRPLRGLAQVLWGLYGPTQALTSSVEAYAGGAIDADVLVDGRGGGILTGIGASSCGCGGRTFEFERRNVGRACARTR